MNSALLEDEEEIKEAFSEFISTSEYQSATRDIQQNLLSTQNHNALTENPLISRSNLQHLLQRSLLNSGLIK